MTSTRILLVEDNPLDAELVLREIQHDGLDCVHRLVATRERFLAALDDFAPDLILSDYQLPAFDGLQALGLARERLPMVPFIVITGSLNEEIAVDCIKAGAWDYVLKDRLSRLVPAVRSALAQAQTHAEKLRADEALRTSEARYRQLAVHLEQVREHERSVMSREVHDELGQSLTALKMDVMWLAQRVRSPQLAAKARDMAGLIDETIGSVQRLCAALRPAVLDDLGLEAAVEWHLRDFERRARIRVSATTAYPERRLDGARETALYRILQEALTNVVRHAGAHAVTVRLAEVEGFMLLEVGDDGAGIPEAALQDPRAFGLIGMQERARAVGGETRVERGPHGGTVVRASVPIESSPEGR